jgi:hypothetical protein
LQFFRHPAEGYRQFPELVPGMQVDPVLQPAGTNRFRSPLERGQGNYHPPYYAEGYKKQAS